MTTRSDTLRRAEDRNGIGSFADSPLRKSDSIREDSPITRHANPGFGSFTLVDVETSGLQSTHHRVLSVAALTLADDGRIAREFHTLVNPGCDPGPVEIHGLTRERLCGAPPFDAVRGKLAELLTGRVMVAHNASFDHGFLAQEFIRAGAVLPVERQLCTLAFARRLSPPTENFKLGTLAAHYGVRQTHAHDALDDARVLAGVLRGLMSDATRFGVSPPLMPTTHRTANRWPKIRSGPKVPCPFIYPGRLQQHGRLVQGMKVAITGETRVGRAEMAGRAEAAGLDVTTSLSRRTSVLVTNEPKPATRKAREAAEYGTSIVTEAQFLVLLADIAPGRPKGVPAAAAKVAPPRSSGPLAGRRFLVLGGTHEQRAVATVNLAERGGSVAVNISASVTDVLALPGAEADRRYPKVAELRLPIHGPEFLTIELVPDRPGQAVAPGCSDQADVPDRPEAVVEPECVAPVMTALSLARGQVIDLPVAECGTEWTLRGSWTQNGSWEVDLVAFLLTADEVVTDDEDFVFYNQPETDGAALAIDGPSEQSLTVSLDDLPTHCHRIVFAAAIDGPGVTFGDVGAIEIEAVPGVELGAFARATLDAATEERTLLLAELYQRGAVWRLRAIGQGYATDLAGLASRFGIVAE